MFRKPLVKGTELLQKQLSCLCYDCSGSRAVGLVAGNSSAAVMKQNAGQWATQGTGLCRDRPGLFLQGMVNSSLLTGCSGGHSGMG